MFHEINSQERIAREYLTFLQILLDDRSTKTALTFDVFKDDEHWWLHTEPGALCKAGFEAKAGLSFLQWFAALEAAGKAKLLPPTVTDLPFTFRIGATPKRFEDLMEKEPAWIKEARPALDLLIGHIAKSKQKRLEIVQAKELIVNCFEQAHEMSKIRPVDRSTQERIDLTKEHIDRMIEYARIDLETISRRFQSELDDTTRELKAARVPEGRSLTNYPDWQRAKARLAAWSEVRDSFQDIDR